MGLEPEMVRQIKLSDLTKKKKESLSVVYFANALSKVDLAKNAGTDSKRVSPLSREEVVARLCGVYSDGF